MSLIKKLAWYIYKATGGTAQEPQVLPDKPNPPRFVISCTIIDNELRTYKVMGRRLDSIYAYTTLQGWWECLEWVYLTQWMPKYFVKPDGTWNMDCEDWAIWLKAMMSIHFGLNSFAFVIGSMPQGIHGFNMFRTDEKWPLWEPNPGFGIIEPFTIGDSYGYNPIEVLV